MTQETVLTVKTLYEDNRHELALTLLNDDDGLDRVIHEHDICRPGLMLSGFADAFSHKKIQVFGTDEQAYLAQLDENRRTEAFGRLIDADIPCIIYSNNGGADAGLLATADRGGVCVLRSQFPTIQIYQKLFDYFNEHAAPITYVHGTLVDVYGIGILFIGKSGIGKSEIALDLVERGHRLVADDVVKISRKSAGVIVGTSKEMLKNMLEIRGVGLIDVWSIFGIRAIRIQKRVEVVVQLEFAEKIEEYDRLGTHNNYKSYLGVEVPFIQLPILPGKNVTVIAEVIALKTMQRVYGLQPEHEFIRRLDEKIKENTHLRNYLSKDVE